MMKILFRNEFTIAIFAALLFIPFLGNVHLFDWDEINFAESAREMLASGNFFNVQINYARFSEKPPLFFWLQALSMKIFGVNEFAARFPNAICGIVSLIMIFKIGKKNIDVEFARIWVMIYCGTFVTFIYFKSGIIDPWFNLFIFSAIYHFYFLTSTKIINRFLSAIYVGFFLGLAVLTKGPVAILIFTLCYFTFIILNKLKIFISLKEFLLIFFSTFIVCFAWFGIDFIQNGPQFIMEFIQRQIEIFSTNDAGHEQPFFYHWWILLFGCFPASLFFLKGLLSKPNDLNQKLFNQWMAILFWITLFLFSIVKTKIVHYSSLCWFPLTYLAAFYIHEIWINKKERIPKIITILISLIGVLLSLILISIPFVLLQKEKWIHLVKDNFAKANLEADVKWNWLDSFGGIILLFGVLYFLFHKNIISKISVLFISVTACCMFTTVILTPKIEAISQRANIDFFKSKQNENCYIETWGYKSYAQYFYSKKKPFENDGTKNALWMLYNNIDKTVYISAKIQSKNELDKIPDLKMLYEKNGFVFYKREIKN